MTTTAKKQSRARLTDTKPVFFAAKTGHLPIESDDHRVIDSRGTREKIPGFHLTFGEKGVTRGYDPTHPDDAKAIKRIRAWIAEGRDERIRLLNVREIRNDADTPPPPFPAFDSTNAKGIVEVIRAGGYDVEKAVLYEEQNGNRADVLKALDDLLSEVSAPKAASPTDEPSL